MWKALAILQIRMNWLMGYFFFKLVKRLPGQGALAARREEAQLAFPGIVMEMRSNPVFNEAPCSAR